jgi:hypothetical protein
MVPDLGHRGHVDGVVQLTVPAPREAVDPAVPGGHLDGGGAVEGAEAVPAREAEDITGDADHRGGHHRADAEDLGVVVFQATRRPRALRPTPPRRTTRNQGDRIGPGRATGERLCRLRGRLTPPHTGSSAQPLPDRHSGYDDPPERTTKLPGATSNTGRKPPDEQRGLDLYASRCPGFSFQPDAATLRLKVVARVRGPP